MHTELPQPTTVWLW